MTIIDAILSGQVHALKDVLAHFTSQSDLAFANDLIANFVNKGSLSPKQAFWVVELTHKATKLAKAKQAPPQAPIAPQVNVGGFANVINLFTIAQAHLKFPKITLKLDQTTVILALAGPKSKFPGSVQVVGAGKYPNRAYYGRVSPTGDWYPSVKGGQGSEMMLAFQAKLEALLTVFAANPAQVATEHGKLTGQCCFCNKTLGLGEDQRSVAVGYGPVCATHFGLKAEWLAGAAIATDPHAAFQAEIVAAENVKVEVPAPTVTSTENLGTATVAADWSDSPTTWTVESLPVLAESLPTKEDLQMKALIHDAVTATPGEAWDDSVMKTVNPWPVSCYLCEQATAVTIRHHHPVCGACLTELGL